MSLPPPIEFREMVIGDTLMMVAADVPNICGLFYLLPSAYSKAHQWIVHPLGTLPILLVIHGPTKSGKSAFLNHVLPSMLTHAHRLSKTPEPVIIKCTFLMSSSPKDAMTEIATQISNMATKLSISHIVPTVNIHLFVVNIAEQIHLLGKCMWLFLDEIAVR